MTGHVWVRKPSNMAQVVLNLARHLLPTSQFTFLFDKIIFSHTFFAIKNSFSNNFQIAKIRVRFETKKNVGRKWTTRMSRRRRRYEMEGCRCCSHSCDCCCCCKGEQDTKRKHYLLISTVALYERLWTRLDSRKWKKKLNLRCFFLLTKKFWASNERTKLDGRQQNQNLNLENRKRSNNWRVALEKESALCNLS